MKVQRFPINASNDFGVGFLLFSNWKIEFFSSQRWFSAFEHAILYFIFFDYNQNWNNSRFARVERQYWQMIITFSMKCLCIRFFLTYRNRAWIEWAGKRVIENRETIFIYFHKLFHFIPSIVFPIPMLNESHSILRMLFLFFRWNSIPFSFIRSRAEYFHLNEMQRIETIFFNKRFNVKSINIHDFHTSLAISEIRLWIFT